MVFEIPSTFNISNFVENVGTGIPVYPVNYMWIKGIPRATISLLNSQDLTLNTGSATYKINLSNEDENPSVTTSAKLYYDGKEVDYSRFDCDFDNNTNKVTVSPNGLKKGGSYIAQIFVTSVSDGQEYTISSNFVLQVQGTFLVQVDISKTSFLNDLDQVLAGAADNVKLVLSGTKNLNFDESPYSPGVSLSQMICNAIRENKSTVVEIDMSAVSGSIGDIFEMANYNKINCSSIKLPSSLRAIRYATGTHIDISGSDSSVSNGTWYAVKIDSSSYGNEDAETILQEVFEGKRSFDSSTRSELEQIYAVSLNTVSGGWSAICNVVQGNTTANDKTIYIKGE